MSEVMEGAGRTLTVSSAATSVANLCGVNPNNNRFTNALLGWYNDVIQDIQRKFPWLRTFLVHNAQIQVRGGQAVYNVRHSVDDGGFGWEDCFQIKNIIVPEISDRPLEFLTLDQWRNRSIIEQEAGPPYGVVLLDQHRLRIVPEPDADYTMFGDYIRDAPELKDQSQYLGWPRAWDSCLLHGLNAYGMRWRYPAQNASWRPYWLIYEQSLNEVWDADKNNSIRPRKAVQTRSLRSRRSAVADPSADIPRWRWWP